MEIHAGVGELRERLRAYLRRVEKGETVVITRHGKRIGAIVPIPSSLEAQLEALGLTGAIQWNGGKLPPIEPVAEAQGELPVSELLLADRE